MFGQFSQLYRCRADGLWTQSRAWPECCGAVKGYPRDNDIGVRDILGDLASQKTEFSCESHRTLAVLQ